MFEVFQLLLHIIFVLLDVLDALLDLVNSSLMVLDRSRQAGFLGVELGKRFLKSSLLVVRVIGVQVGRLEEISERRVVEVVEDSVEGVEEGERVVRFHQEHSRWELRVGSLWVW